MDDLVIINHPIQDVFAYIADHSNDKYWKPFVTESRKISAGEIGVGTQFEIVIVAWGYRRAGMVEILEYEPYCFYAYRANDPVYPFVARLTFSETPSGTHFHGQVEFQAKGVWKLFTPLFQMFIGSQSRQTFARLKEIMEASEPKTT